MEEKRFNESSFLVKDDSLKDISCEFYQYLKKEGFDSIYGHWDTTWAFVNIDNMNYAYGRPGVLYVPVLFDHAITIEEFKTIWDIFKKYKDKKLMEF